MHNEIPPPPVDRKEKQNAPRGPVGPTLTRPGEEFMAMQAALVAPRRENLTRARALAPEHAAHVTLLPGKAPVNEALPLPAKGEAEPATFEGPAPVQGALPLHKHEETVEEQ